MTSNDLRKIKTKLEEKIQRRNKLNKYLNDKKIQKFIDLANIKVDKKDVNKEKLLNEVLNDIIIKNTDNIYICDAAYTLDCIIEQDDKIYYERKVDFGYKDIKYKDYINIESEVSTICYKDESILETSNIDKFLLINDFEKENIVLNPYNISGNNGFNEVRLEYFLNALEFGKTKAKSMLLKKYKRM